MKNFGSTPETRGYGAEVEAMMLNSIQSAKPVDNERERFCILPFYGQPRKPPQCTGHDTDHGRITCYIKKEASFSYQ